MDNIKIGNKKIGVNEPCYIIAEAGSNHDGKLEQAKLLVDIAADAGVDAVKFQAFKADKLFENEDVVGKLRKLEFQEDWMEELYQHTQSRNITLFFSVFDEDWADILDKMGAEAYKVASYEMMHKPLLEHLAQKQKPIIISTGMADLEEVKESVEYIKSYGNNQIVIMHCVSQYPARKDDINLKSILTLLENFNFPIGFSDHTLGIEASLIAVAMGAKVIEKHFTPDNSLEGPDHSYALNPDELKNLVDGIRNVEKMMGRGDVQPNPSEINEREYRRAIYAKKEIKEGQILTKNSLIILRPSPSESLPPKFLKDILGKRTTKRLDKGSIITKDVVEW